MLAATWDATSIASPEKQPAVHYEMFQKTSACCKWFVPSHSASVCLCHFKLLKAITSRYIRVNTRHSNKPVLHKRTTLRLVHNDVSPQPYMQVRTNERACKEEDELRKLRQKEQFHGWYHSQRHIRLSRDISRDNVHNGKQPL
jgi:hypothetical protein